MFRLSLRVPLPRLFSTSVLRSQHVPSSCAAGTVLNLKVRKNGDEPVALEDSEYPDWLWTILDKKGNDEKLKAEDIMRWRKKQLNKANAEKIKANNFLSKKK
ncbi:hypothetical protein PUMCH_003141 [Australozyma saopauloensis]|uniref:Large ribosomal subunit protein mL54 n=1 Tax=Australozyma saopauloensis TaxID=291208 RepID=A0AAX4HBA0_9ASCO|nr:hypothetical protein PUMCH_003141 [[Candida] saopauloensis]